MSTIKISEIKTIIAKNLLITKGVTSSMHTTKSELLSWILNTEILPECNVEIKEKIKIETYISFWEFQYLFNESFRNKGKVKEYKKEIKTEIET